MGVIEIGERRARLENLGQVRQSTVPDGSAAWRGLEALGGQITRSAINLPQAIEHVNAVFERHARVDAEKLQTQYMELMNTALNNPGDPQNPEGAKGLFLSAQDDDKAAEALEENLKEARTQALKTIGYEDANRRTKELFDGSVQAFDLSNLRRANAISAARFDASEKGSAKAALDACTRAALVNPTAANYASAMEAFVRDARTNGMNEDQTREGGLAFHRSLVVGTVAERMSSVKTSDEAMELVEALKDGDIRGLSKEDKELADWLQAGFEHLSERERSSLIDSAVKKQASLSAMAERAYEAQISEATIRARQGAVSSAELFELEAKWEREGVSAALRNKLDVIAASRAGAEAAAAIEAALSGDRSVDVLESMSQTMKTTPEWIRAMSAAKANAKESYLAAVKDEAQTILDDAVYNRGPLMLSVEDRIKLIDNPSIDPAERGLLQRGLISFDDAEKAKAAIRTDEDARLHGVMSHVFSSLSATIERTRRAVDGRIEPFIDVIFRTGSTGDVDIDKTYAAARSYDGGIEKKEVASLTKEIQKVVDTVRDVARKNPSYTSRELEDLTNDLLYPLMPSIVKIKLQQNSYDRQNFDRKLNAVKFLLERDDAINPAGTDSPAAWYLQASSENMQPNEPSNAYMRDTSERKFSPVKNPDYAETVLQKKQTASRRNQDLPSR